MAPQYRVYQVITKANVTARGTLLNQDTFSVCTPTAITVELNGRGGFADALEDRGRRARDDR